MANNKMYLVNQKTGESVFIGKYYPATGWYIFDTKTLCQRMDEAFHKVDFGNVAYEEAQNKQISAIGGMWGDCSWCIRYDNETTKTD